jgi:hypothetical protein
MQRNINAVSFRSRYQSHSDRKSLIYIGLVPCLFSGQLKQSLDFQCPGETIDYLSTKLSTETLDDYQNLLKSST